MSGEGGNSENDEGCRDEKRQVRPPPPKSTEKDGKVNIRRESSRKERGATVKIGVIVKLAPFLRAQAITGARTNGKAFGSCKWPGKTQKCNPLGRGEVAGAGKSGGENAGGGGRRGANRKKRGGNRQDREKSKVSQNNTPWRSE